MRLLKLFLLAAALLSAQPAMIDCSNPASSQTQPVRGPSGVTAVVKISSQDDHSKDSHDCMAKYELVVQPADGGAPVAAELLSSDGDWGRKLTAHVDGFTPDGQRIFGILAEPGQTPMALLFSYHATDGEVQLLDLRKALRQIAAAKCGASVAVAGTSSGGAIVLEGAPASQCRWLLDPTNKTVRRLPPGKSIASLFKE